MPKKNRQATRTTPGFTGPFKGQPQQGTLFDVRTVPKTGDEIGPRGYSLNRSRQFQGIIGGVGDWPKYSTPSVGLGSREGIAENSHPYTENRGDQESFEGGGLTGRGRSKLIDTLARSTVRPEHLEGLRRISIEHSDDRYAGTYHRSGPGVGRINLNVTRATAEEGEQFSRSLEDRAHGDYATNFPERVKRPEQRGPVDHDAEITLIHEIGHHVSNRQGNESAVRYEGRNQAVEEGRADRHAMETWRQDPRETRWRGRIDPREHTYTGRGNIPGLGAYDQDYHKTLGAQNAPSAEMQARNERLRSLVPGTWLESAAHRERKERPMLDETHMMHREFPDEEDEHGRRHPEPGAFSYTLGEKAIRGWVSSNGAPEEEHHRDAQYKIVAQRRNMGKRGGSRMTNQQNAERKARWGVTNRRQFGDM